LKGDAISWLISLAGSPIEGKGVRGFGIQSISANATHSYFLNLAETILNGSIKNIIS
jgi:hypothetical protein